MLEDEHREICFLDDTTDPHGERRFKRSCIDYYNEIMEERSQVPTIPQYAMDDSTGEREEKR